MARDCVIYGDSSFAERVYSYMRLEKDIRVVGFTNDERFITRSEIQGQKVFPFSFFLEHLKDGCELILAYGYSGMGNLKEKVFRECLDAGCRIGSFFSPQAILFTDRIGDGTIILPGVIIGPGTVIGRCNFFEAACVVSHDSVIGDFNYFSTGAVLGGFSNVGSHCFIGLNSTIKNEVSLADYSLIGAASNVLISTEEDCVYAGNPAKMLKKGSLNTKI